MASANGKVECAGHWCNTGCTRRVIECKQTAVLRRFAKRLAESQLKGCHCQYRDGYPDPNAPLCELCKISKEITG